MMEHKTNSNLTNLNISDFETFPFVDFDAAWGISSS